MERRGSSHRKLINGVVAPGIFTRRLQYRYRLEGHAWNGRAANKKLVHVEGQ
jgi:hypothetical protein